jgi:hypothetical protein
LAFEAPKGSQVRLGDDYHVPDIGRKPPQHRLMEVAEQFEVGRVRGRHDDHLPRGIGWRGVRRER